ncbi:hypothetical protein Va33_12090 [Helicobacter pylori]
MGIRKTCIKFYWNGLEKSDWIDPYNFSTNCLITIEYNYIHYNNKILMGKIVF